MVRKRFRSTLMSMPTGFRMSFTKSTLLSNNARWSASSRFSSWWRKDELIHVWSGAPRNHLSYPILWLKLDKTASIQKEAMCTQVALWLFFMKWNMYRAVPLCLSKQNVWTHRLRKAYCFKRLWSVRNDWIWLHLFIKNETCPSWHIIRTTTR